MICISAILDSSHSGTVAVNPPCFAFLKNRFSSEDHATYYFFLKTSIPAIALRSGIVASQSFHLLRFYWAGEVSRGGASGGSPAGLSDEFGGAGARAGCIKIYTSLDGFKTRERWRAEASYLKKWCIKPRPLVSLFYLQIQSFFLFRSWISSRSIKISRGSPEKSSGKSIKSI
jgi:hypothetical protein